MIHLFFTITVVGCSGQCERTKRNEADGRSVVLGHLGALDCFGEEALLGRGLGLTESGKSADDTWKVAGEEEGGGMNSMDFSVVALTDTKVGVGDQWCIDIIQSKERVVSPL